MYHAGYVTLFGTGTVGDDGGDKVANCSASDGDMAWKAVAGERGDGGERVTCDDGTHGGSIGPGSGGMS